MFSPLVPSGDNPPVKNIFHGTGPYADAYRAALDARGAIDQFAQKARQGRDASGLSQYAIHQDLPDGGRLRYSSNNGQETLNVEMAASGLPEDYDTCTPKPILSVDVVFHPSRFTAGDIHTKVPGAEPNDDYTTWDKVHLATEPVQVIEQSYPKSVSYAADDPGSFFGSKTYDDGQERLGGLSGSYVLYGNDAKTYGAIRNAVEHLTDYTDLDNAVGDPGGYEQTTNLKTYDYGYAGMDFSTPAKGATWAIVLSAGSTSFVYPHGPPLGEYFESTRFYAPVEFYARQDDSDKSTREVRTYLDALPVVGIVVTPHDPKDAPYHALSDGTSSDKRIKPIVDGEQQTVTRQIAFADPDGGDRFYGYTFLVYPIAKVVTGAGAEKVEIELYLASANVKQSNIAPGLTTSKYGTDDSSMSYDATTQLTYTIRLREIDTQPYIVEVDTKVQGQIETYDTDGVLTSTTLKDDAVEVIWRFAAASSDWTDGGKEPTDPDAVSARGQPTMGALLDATQELGFTPVKPTTAVAARMVVTTPTWSGEVTDMTKVATAEWTPPDRCHVAGKGKITPIDPPAATGGGVPGLGQIV